MTHGVKDGPDVCDNTEGSIRGSSDSEDYMCDERNARRQVTNLTLTCLLPLDRRYKALRDGQSRTYSEQDQIEMHGLRRKYYL